MSELTAREIEQVRGQVVKAARARLDSRKPDESLYRTGDGRDAQIIGSVLLWSKAAIPVVAVLAALASSVRTVQVVSTLYSDAGSHPVGVLIAALAITLAVEGTLFVLALAQEGEALRRRSERAARHVGSLRGLWYGVLVRLGLREPLRWDEMPESSGGIKIVLALALTGALATNLYLGMKPIIDQMGAVSLQSFISGLWDAPAALQMAFLVDLVLALFAPTVAFAAGHLTARYASEIAQRAAAGRLAYERDLEQWRAAYADPLATDEGAEMLEEYLEHKQQVKAARQASKQRPFGSTAPDQAAGDDTQPMRSASGHIVSVNGHVTK